MPNVLNWWLLSAGVLTLVVAGGHALAGPRMFYLPLRAALSNEFHRAVLAYIWHLITIHLVVLGLALAIASTRGRAEVLAWAAAAQFAGYAVLSVAIGLQLGDVRKLPQWMLFGATALLAAVGAS
jgi:hypothetical protein